MPEPTEIKPKIETEPEGDLVVAQFKKLEELKIDIEKDFPLIHERLLELNGEKESHFYDAIKMTEIIDLLWDKIKPKKIFKDEEEEKKEKEKMKLSALLHDIGKSGPLKFNNSPEKRKVIEKLFNHKTFKDSRDKSIREALAAEQVENREEVENLLQDLGVDLDHETMIDFWHLHADWTYDILTNNKKGLIDDEVVNIASSHHILDGKNPAELPLENISEGSKALEIIDKYQILTLVDKYQAWRGRDAFSHKDAIEELRKIVKKNSPPEAIEGFERIIDILNRSEEELKEIFRENQNA